MLATSNIHLAKTMPSSAADNAIKAIGEVANYLKVTERTIYRLAGAEQIPAFKVGGSWRFSEADIDGWIKKQSLEGLDESETRANHPQKLAARGDK